MSEANTFIDRKPEQPPASRRFQAKVARADADPLRCVCDITADGRLCVSCLESVFDDCQVYDNFEVHLKDADICTSFCDISVVSADDDEYLLSFRDPGTTNEVFEWLCRAGATPVRNMRSLHSFQPGLALFQFPAAAPIVPSTEPGSGPLASSLFQFSAAPSAATFSPSTTASATASLPPAAGLFQMPPTSTTYPPIPTQPFPTATTLPSFTSSFAPSAPLLPMSLPAFTFPAAAATGDAITGQTQAPLASSTSLMPSLGPSTMFSSDKSALQALFSAPITSGGSRLGQYPGRGDKTHGIGVRTDAGVLLNQADGMQIQSTVAPVFASGTLGFSMNSTVQFGLSVLRDNTIRSKAANWRQRILAKASKDLVCVLSEDEQAILLEQLQGCDTSDLRELLVRTLLIEEPPQRSKLCLEFLLKHGLTISPRNDSLLKELVTSLPTTPGTRRLYKPIICEVGALLLKAGASVPKSATLIKDILSAKLFPLLVEFCKYDPTFLTEQSLFHFGARTNQKSCWEFLLRNGGNVNARVPEYGNITALHHSILCVMPQFSAWLQAHGADMHARCTYGETPDSLQNPATADFDELPHMSDTNMNFVLGLKTSKLARKFGVTPNGMWFTYNNVWRCIASENAYVGAEETASYDAVIYNGQVMEFGLTDLQPYSGERLELNTLSYSAVRSSLSAAWDIQTHAEMHIRSINVSDFQATVAITSKYNMGFSDGRLMVENRRARTRRIIPFHIRNPLQLLALDDVDIGVVLGKDRILFLSLVTLRVLAAYRSDPATSFTCVCSDLSYVFSTNEVRCRRWKLPAWLRAWTPATHAQFPPKFRSAVRTILLLTARDAQTTVPRYPHCWLPHDIVTLLIVLLAQGVTEDCWWEGVGYEQPMLLTDLGDTPAAF
eukprot:TRINITY_DN8318_c0_g2_i1.p1 TRINITY_DN8318_c0_g2~~TRINITY_DN8318_c0_g2_i1.p1  ORF type:complete len:895 (+),score=148.46 TRINITY_DN8318_c0_g2_i1:139-2823(+)